MLCEMHLSLCPVYCSGRQLQPRWVLYSRHRFVLTKSYSLSDSERITSRGEAVWTVTSSSLWKTHAILYISPLLFTKLKEAKKVDCRKVWLAPLKISLSAAYCVFINHLQLNFDRLRTLTGIDEYARKQAKQSSVKRFLMLKSDIVKTSGYRKRLGHALNIFWVCASDHIFRRLITFKLASFGSFSATVKHLRSRAIVPLRHAARHYVRLWS